MRAIFLVLALVLPLSLPAAAGAVQYVSNGKVVHTRLAPVVAHRISPPYRGQHVYGGRRGGW